MARPSSSRAKNRFEPDSLTIPDGTELVEYRLKRAESLVERRARLRQEFLAFLVKDLLAYLVAFGLIGIAALYCFSVLLKHGETLEDRRWAMSIVGSLLTALVGFAFGKATK